MRNQTLLKVSRTRGILVTISSVRAVPAKIDTNPAGLRYCERSRQLSYKDYNVSKPYHAHMRAARQSLVRIDVVRVMPLVFSVF